MGTALGRGQVEQSRALPDQERQWIDDVAGVGKLLESLVLWPQEVWREDSGRVPHRHLVLARQLDDLAEEAHEVGEDVGVARREALQEGVPMSRVHLAAVGESSRVAHAMKSSYSSKVSSGGVSSR